MDVLNGTPENYILPFFWQMGTHRDTLRKQIGDIASCGVGAICVESRPHKEFAGEGWWADMDIILDECEKRGMKVWILDDDHFPTGHANGLLAKYPERRKWALVENHLDAAGPMRGASILLQRNVDENNILIGVYAYRREKYSEELPGEPVELTANVRGKYLFWDIPEGCYRIFAYYRTRDNIGKTDYIDMISEESVDTLIEAVYETHYKHYARYFGNTLAGFFSDEPQLGNEFAGARRFDCGLHYKTVGMPGLALPWNDKVSEMMREELGFAPEPYLASLWYYMEGFSERVRYSYMNSVSKLYRDSFCRKLGDWCRAHGVMYIGHIIEDQNSHARLGCSAGHYFRSLEGQDMSGIDIVLHQVMPGMENVIHTGSCAGNDSDGQFYNYVLAKLASSLSDLKPEMKGRAMCEVFGAYGWAESVPFMKWLVDFLLVRGVNHFVPHAFSPIFPNYDCPPHFGSGGQDPQYEGFKTLMRYLNKASHMLFGARHIVSAAILYSGEAEWMNGDWYVPALNMDERTHNSFMYSQKPARVLYDDHIDFDIVPVDYLSDAVCADRKLVINGVSMSCLIIPSASVQSEDFYREVRRIASEGVPVWFVDRVPKNLPDGFPETETVPLEELARKARRCGFAEISVEGQGELLRIYHCVRDGKDIYMFFNESLSKSTDAVVTLPGRGRYVLLDLLSDGSYEGYSADGKVEISLEPYQSCILDFIDGDESGLPAKTSWRDAGELHAEYDVSLADAADMETFKPYRRMTELVSVTGADELPDFSGRIKYHANVLLKRCGRLAVDLGEVGSTAELILNGKSVGMRICRPYRFELTEFLNDGMNELEIIVSNTLANREKDNFSKYMPIPPSGLLGPVKVLRAD